ncbi:MAG: hypothetical protein PWQ25_1847 [Deferribacteres bacterium]|jgi:hypothetical protein|nr:hypothetical protein [Deferribacteres bacterium]
MITINKLVDILSYIYSKNKDKVIFIKTDNKLTPVASIDRIIDIIGQPEEIIIKSKNDQTFIIKG